MTEDQLEQEALGWLADVGYAHLDGPDIAHDGSILFSSATGHTVVDRCACTARVMH